MATTTKHLELRPVIHQHHGLNNTGVCIPSTVMQTPISTLRFFPGNARRGDIDLIAESLQHLGQYRPVVVNRGEKAPEYTDTILAGNHTVMAAQHLGWDTVQVNYVDYDAETCKRVVLVDNKSNDSSTYDVEALVNLATELPDLTATGFSRDEIDAMLEVLDAPDEEDGNVPDDLSPEGYGLIVECDDKNQRDSLKAKLVAEGFTVGNA